MAKRHWNDKSFVLVREHIEQKNEDGTFGYGAQIGYCRECKADMQRFIESDGSWGFLRHYKSHTYLRRGN